MLKEYDIFLDYSKNILTLIQPYAADKYIKENKLKINTKVSCKMNTHLPMPEVLIGNKKI